VDPGAAVALVAHGGTVGIVVELVLILGLVGVFLAVKLGTGRDEEPEDEA
jgi:hypothetical protein